MSVILDALHKARGDKRNPQPEARSGKTARVLDAGVASEAMLDAHPVGTAARQGRQRWMIALAVVFSALCFFMLIAGAFFFLYMQGKRLEEKQVMDPGVAGQGAAVTSSRPPVMAVAGAAGDSEAAKVLETGLNLPPTPALPTPLPLSDLPVQPPTQPAATALSVEVSPSQNAEGTVAPAAMAAPGAAPTFKLGSIVCENEDCLASLNGRTVRVGDEIRQYRILRITAKDVTLKSITGNDVITLSLYD